MDTHDTKQGKKLDQAGQVSDQLIKDTVNDLMSHGGPLATKDWHMEAHTESIARRTLRAIGYPELIDRVECAEAVCHSICTVPMVQEDEEDGPDEFLVVHPGPARIWAEKYGDRK